MSQRVAILGGGVGGLTAAHELVERGFEVVLFERNDLLGGKSRSNTKPRTGVNGLKDLPGEHGFRFFPGFYKHLPHTMRRIPLSKNGKKTVRDNLVLTKEIQLARKGADELLAPAHFPRTPTDMMKIFNLVFNSRFHFEREDIQFFFGRLLVLLSSCWERRVTEYERRSWLDFIQWKGRKDEEKYRKYFADGLTRSLVAARADKMSARTGGYVLLQLIFDLTRPGGQVDRVLCAPTNDAWFDPWRDYLIDSERWDSPVQIELGAEIVKLHFDGEKITGIDVRQNGAMRTETDFDFYISALPVEVMKELVNEEMERFDPILRRLKQLETEWMTGIQFYLKNDIKDVLGHTLYIDSEWALTSISQRRFWPDVPIHEYGDGSVQGVLSVDISDWNHLGTNGKTAKQCTADEVKDEVWQQLKDHLNDDDSPDIHDEDLIDWYLDPAIQFPDPNDPNNSEIKNREPLLINTVGSWSLRPDAITAIKNLFLAADYVRTNTDLATMESANEAARRAVNGILDACRSRKRRCRIWPLKEPRSFALLRAYDRWRFRHGKPFNENLVNYARYLFVPIWITGFTVMWIFWHLMRLLRLVRV